MSGAWTNFRWLIAYWLSRAGVAVGRFLPTRLCYALSGPFADLAFVLLRRHRRNLIANLARVVGPEQAETTARRVFRNFGRYVIDFYQLPARGAEALRRRVRFDDWQRLDEALANGRGTIFVTLHLGQAELGGASIAAYGRPISVIAERLPCEPMNEFVQGLRRRLGMTIIPAKRAKPEVLRCLNRGEVLALMFDAVEAEDGLRVDFFGAPATVSGTPARIALRTGARIVPAVVGRDPHDPALLLPVLDFDLRFEPTGDDEADAVALSQAVAASLEQQVRRFADQWFAFRPVWGAGAPAEAGPREESGTGGRPRWQEAGLIFGTRLGGYAPRPLAYAFARLGSDLAYALRAGARADVADNLRHVMGETASERELEAAGREVFRNVGRYFVDLIRLSHTSAEEMRRTVRMHGFDRLKSRLDAGQGVIVVTGHYGNPEMAPQLGAVLGLNVLVLAEPLQPPAFAELMRRNRAALGARYIDVGYSAVAAAIRHLRAGGCLAITVDRDIQGSGVPLPFFGVETPLPLGAVELAARTGAVILPGFCRREGSGFDLYFEEPVPMVDTGRPKADALVNARAVLARVEPWLRRDPGQWMVLQRVWKQPPPKPERERVAGYNGLAERGDGAGNG